ncbi:hypothetical protein HAX54_003245 [Datura stramonium]|uniref:DNA helicase n=1 Tax=Datura stramonium TaxID=4076 RepID=A0ABS8T522_DATST|nr:hypothetical protein [Datura stramonium]
MLMRRRPIQISLRSGFGMQEGRNGPEKKENGGENYNNPAYLKERAILTPKNEMVHELNDTIMKLIPGQEERILASMKVSLFTVPVSGKGYLWYDNKLLKGESRRNWRNQVQRLKDKLIEGSLYTIQNFKVVEAISRYKPVENSLTLIFTASIVINNLSEDIVHISINGFQFIKPSMINSRVNNDKVLSGRWNGEPRIDVEKKGH